MVKRIILYSRSAVDGPALERKLAACRAWARDRGAAVVGEFSEVMNGHAEELPEWERAIESARRERAALVCLRPSDLGRDAQRVAGRLAACQHLGVPIRFIDGAGQGRSSTRSRVRQPLDR